MWQKALIFAVLSTCASWVCAEESYVRKHFFEVTTGTEPSPADAKRFPIHFVAPSSFVRVQSPIPDVGVLLGKKEEIDVVMAASKPSPVEVGMFRVSLSMNAGFDGPSGKFSGEPLSLELKERMAASSTVLLPSSSTHGYAR